MKHSIIKTDTDYLDLNFALWDILKWQAEKYNGIDSTSLSIEKAGQLMESLLYTIDFYGQQEDLSLADILQMDLKEVVKKGQELLDDMRKEGRAEYEMMLMDLVQIPNGYYVDTVKEIGQFFKRYEIYYSAHEIPCAIDYQLLIPVPEELKGISYIMEYMKRLEIENSFLKKFRTSQLLDFYKKLYPDYEEELFNLADQLLTNEVCRMLSDQEISELSCLGKEELALRIREASERLLGRLSMDEEAREYLTEAVVRIVPRLYEALRAGNVSGVFVGIK